ncbi:hypothetical protein [Streptosporangium minutum]|uniref:hypothetical protein n=1 Tax=Streptosporangium minutum TaxID=569862 RepID=UPI001A9962FD|nr:hypothetical protein [Streptosporangium minutum]
MPSPLSRRSVSAALTALVLHAMIGAPAAADTGREQAHPAGRAVIGVRLLEIPANRVDDPRSHSFIVDHVNPGTTFTRRFEVYSTSPKPQHVRLYAAAAGIKGSRFTFAPAQTPNELSSWVTLNRSSADLPARGKAPVKATIAVPAWATEAERYAVIWAEVASPGPGPKGNIALVNRVGIRAYLDVGPGGEPPSDFEIGEIVPQRTDDGQPKIVATVANTGKRAIDLEGQLSLSEGPSSLSAGPFPANRDTTLAPGGRGDITVLLGRDLPDGPWTFHLTLRSGRVSHTATGTLTFPTKAGTWGMPAALSSPLTLTLALAVLVALVAAAILALGFRRFHARRQSSATGHPHGDLT